MKTINENFFSAIKIYFIYLKSTKFHLFSLSITLPIGAIRLLQIFYSFYEKNIFLINFIKILMVHYYHHKKKITTRHKNQQVMEYSTKEKEKELAIRIPNLQNIFKAKLMVLFNAFTIANTEYSNKPIHIFTDCLNELYVIKTQIKNPTLYNNHLNVTILKEIVELL